MCVDICTCTLALSAFSLVAQDKQIGKEGAGGGQIVQ